MKTSQDKSKENLLTKSIDDDDDEDLSSDNEALQIIFTIASLLLTHYDQVDDPFLNLYLIHSFSLSYHQKINKFLLHFIPH
jgi:hypothetical protein